MSTLLLILITTAGAQTRQPASPIKGLVWTDQDYGPLRKVLPAKWFRFRDRADETREMHAEGQLTPRERDEVFARLKLGPKLRGLDELQKDMLVMDTRAFTLRELKAYHPYLSPADLAALKTAVGRYK